MFLLYFLKKKKLVGADVEMLEFQTDRKHALQKKIYNLFWFF